MKVKMVQIDEETWLRLGKLKSFPTRTTFREVIAWLLDEQAKREEARELLK